ncbi:acyl carrier protein [Paracoccus sulfuroxidans]|uniref:Phosphopantetheine binding protein n=1 Tax=Paracoccus sulfuroxidans TaxID=384678 RepID=A0A562N7J8_9RHOB|nr:acyl carrier protein [Paracoccus sulfuroxidans]TWI28172.1 phosphopantetheine binding protein [Paracoccus sulfuroxidans]
MATPDKHSLVEFLRAEVAKRTDTDPSKVTERSDLVDLRLSSSEAVLLCCDIEDEFRIEFEPSLVFSTGTLGEFADAIISAQAA